MMDQTDSTKEKKDDKPQTAEEKKAAATLAAEEENVEQKLKEVEKEFKDEQGRIVKPNTINDRTLKDEEIPGFVARLQRLGIEKQELRDEDIIDLFLLRGRDDEELKRKYLEWAKHIKKKAPGFWEKIKNAVKAAAKKYWQYGNFPHGFVFERVYGALLDKHVQELHVANLNARDRWKLFDHALELRDKFEAQTILLSQGHTSDFDEDYLEKFHRFFSKQEYVIVRDATGPVRADTLDRPLEANETIIDFHGEKVLAQLDYPGTVDDMWFEVKLRRETHIRGKRPDVWHAGRRDYLWHGNHIVGVALKSEKWIAEETNFDGRLTPGRKGDTASETFQYNMLGGDKVLAEGMRELLKKKLAKIERELTDPVYVQHYESKKQKLSDEIKSLEDYKESLAGIVEEERLIDEKIVELKAELAKLEKKRRDDERHRELIDERLKKGIDPNGIKSLLLNKESMDSVTIQYRDEQGRIQERTVYEHEVAYNRGTFIYAMARSDRDAEIVTNAEHVTAEERLSQAQFFSNNYRDELQWRAQHYSFGIHDINGNYDSSRDGSQTIWKAMFDVKTRGGQNFQENALNYFVTSGRINGARRIIVNYDDSTGRSHQLWLDYELPQEPSEYVKSIRPEDPGRPGFVLPGTSMEQEWRAMIDRAFAKGQFYSETMEETKPPAKPKLGPLAKALIKTELSPAQEVLSRPKTGTFKEEIKKAKDELQAFREAAADEPGTFAGLPPQIESRVREIVKTLIRGREDRAYRVQYADVEQGLSLTGIVPNQDEKQRIEAGLIIVRGKLTDYEQAMNNSEQLEDDFQPMIDRILKERGDEPALWYARRLEKYTKGTRQEPSLIDRVERKLPEERTAVLTDEQRQELAELLKDTVPEGTTALQAWGELNKLRTAMSLVRKELQSPEEAEPQAREQRVAA